MTFLTFLRRFPTTFRRFPKIFPKLFQRPDKHFRTFSTEHFSKIAEDDRRRSEDGLIIHQQIYVRGTKAKCYQKWYLYMWGYHIFTCDDISFLSVWYHSVDHLLLHIYVKLFSSPHLSPRCSHVINVIINAWIPINLMVSVLDSGSSGPGLSPGRGHCAVFLSKSFSSHSASYHPGVQFRYQQIQCLLWITLGWTSITLSGKSSYF